MNMKSLQVIDFVRFALNAANFASLYPWYQKLSSLKLLSGGLPGVDPGTTNLLFYMFIFYPFFVLAIFIFSSWFAAINKKYTATFVSSLPLLYLLFLYALAQQLTAAAMAAAKREVIKGVGGAFDKLFKGIF